MQPFILRRTKLETLIDLPPKHEVILYVFLSDLQLKIYRNLIGKYRNPLGNNFKKYANITMHLRKVCNHPYLFDEVQEISREPLGEHIIHVSGKLQVVDRLLCKLKKEGCKVLLFSQMVRMLDILEDFCTYRKF